MFRFKHLAIIASICTLSVTSWGQTKVCVDPGHGGSDPGAVGNGQQEKTNALNTSLKFRNWINADRNDGGGGGYWTSFMTRTTDVYVSLSGRTSYANNNGVARFMSIHNNACCGASGTETFSYTSGSANSHDLRNKIQYRSVQAWGLTNRGNKTANFYVIRYTNMPATLAELGFITHSYDAGFLGNATQQDKMAKHHLWALQNHFGITAYTPGSTSLPTYTNDSPSASGWSVGTSAGDKYGSNYLFRSTAAVSNPATWAINVGVAGTYKIQAWWPAGSNRSSTAPFLPAGGGTYPQNQQINGGKWNTVVTRHLGTGAQNTQLSCWTTSGYVVIADAVRYTP